MGVTDTGEAIGIKNMQQHLREECPTLQFGYLNPPIERIKGNFQLDFAH